MLSWVNWERVVRDFKNGGLNVGSLQASNWALLGKWWWRFGIEKEALWVKVVKSIYGDEGGLKGQVSSNLGRSSVWSNIVRIGKDLDKVGLEFSASFGIILGNGSETKFWMDRWLGNVELGKSFKRLYHLESNNESKVSERGGG